MHGRSRMTIRPSQFLQCRGGECRSLFRGGRPPCPLPAPFLRCLYVIYAAQRSLAGPGIFVISRDFTRTSLQVSERESTSELECIKPSAGSERISVNIVDRDKKKTRAAGSTDYIYSYLPRSIFKLDCSSRLNRLANTRPTRLRKPIKHTPQSHKEACKNLDRLV